MTLPVRPECVSESKIVCNIDLEDFSDLILMISEVPENQLKHILGLVLHITENINMVIWTGGPLDLSITASMCFRWYKWVKHWPTSHFWAKF